MDVGKVVWLASYPKSGNTWLRIILNEVLSPGAKPLESIPTLTREFPSEAPLHEIRGEKVKIVKTHLSPELPRFADMNHTCAAVITIYRHPLDILLSAANYASMKGGNFFFPDRPAKAVDQILRDGEMASYLDAFIESDGVPRFSGTSGPWSAFQRSWDEWANTKRHLRIRYESLVEDPVGGIGSVCEFLGVDGDTEYARAIADRAERQTRLNGRFFWRKKAFNYRGLVEPELARRFCAHYVQELEYLGYPGSG